MRTYIGARPLTAVIVVLALSAVHGSGPIGVYGLVDTVVTGPDQESPRWVQIWGTFAVATSGVGGSYDPPQRGYLYLEAPAGARERQLAIFEWDDLDGVAGTGQVVGFGRAGFDASAPMPIHVRAASEPRANADVFYVGVGVVRMRADSDYGPVRALLASRR